MLPSQLVLPEPCVVHPFMSPCVPSTELASQCDSEMSRWHRQVKVLAIIPRKGDSILEKSQQETDSSLRFRPFPRQDSFLLLGHRGVLDKRWRGDLDYMLGHEEDHFERETPITWREGVWG